MKPAQTTNQSKRQRFIFVARITALIIGVVCTIVFPPWRLVFANLMPLPDTIEEYVKQGTERGFDGIILYIDRAGEPPAFYSAGWHDRDKKIPANPHALFKLASISKLYDALAITKLVSNNQLSLDASLAQLFPNLVGRIENAEEITLRMLVQHRSGIPNITDVENFWVKPPITQQEALALILDKAANFPPNQEFEYSNTNYLLLSMLIEKTTGMAKFEYIKQAILVPNELHNTYGSLSEVDTDKVMSGYYVGIEHDIKMSDYGTELTAMIGTAEDVGKFIRALNDGSIFTDEKEQAIYSELYFYGHTGLMPGYQSIARYHPDIDTVMVQFANTANFSDYQHWGLFEIQYNRTLEILRQ
ncbi:serine hydrolase domain-containing protein [Glaciecola sp. 1036]|uniref:serine hydrolase domain-containing protein n=1 Tax=Alteromonadaceae TaxID=72275 RepID=UPI003D04D2BE